MNHSEITLNLSQTNSTLYLNPIYIRHIANVPLSNVYIAFCQQTHKRQNLPNKIWQSYVKPARLKIDLGSDDPLEYSASALRR